MTAAAHLRKGWCPGALRPMRSGDGLLVRVRPRAGAFTLSALHAVAETAKHFGSGEIDLTNRGNLQLRGVSNEGYDAAIDALRAACLIDETAAIEAVRNVVVDPLSSIDPARSYVRALAAAFEGIVVDDARLWALPGKFGVSFSGTSEPRVGGRAADIMIASDGDRFAVFLDGAAEVSCAVSEDNLLTAVRRLLLAFLDLAANDPSVRRMRDAVAAHGAPMIFAKAEVHATQSRGNGGSILLRLSDCWLAESKCSGLASGFRSDGSLPINLIAFARLRRRSSTMFLQARNEFSFSRSTITRGPRRS